MAIKRQGIWIRSTTQPQPIVNQPDFEFRITGANINFTLPGAGLSLTQSDNSINTDFYLNITPNPGTDNPVPAFFVQTNVIDVSQPNNFEFQYNAGDNILTFVVNVGQGAGITILKTWQDIAALWNSIPLGQINSIPNTSFTFRRAANWDVREQFPTEVNNPILTFTYVSNFVDPRVISNLPSPQLFGFTPEPQGVFSITYRQSNLTTLSSFLGGGFSPGQNGDLVFPFQGWRNTPPGDLINSDGSIANLDDLWEIYAVYDDQVNLSPLQFIGVPYRAGEVFSQFFKDYLETIAPPGIENVQVTTSSNTADNTIVDLIFNKTDGTSNTVQFEIPKPTTPVDIDVSITDTPININVVDEPVVIDLSVVEGNKIDIDTTVTNVAFTGSDITNVDLTVEENDIRLRTDSTEVIFQHQGSQGLRGTGFTVIFRRSIITPAIPSGGTFNTATNTVTVPNFWNKDPSGTTGDGTLYVSFGKLEAGNTKIIWTIPTEIAGGTGGGGSGTGTAFRIAQPTNPQIGLIWARRFTYSQNLRVGNEQSSTWLEIVPGLGDVTLTANGTNTERDNYLILDANVAIVDRSVLDFINSNNKGRKE